MNKLSRSWCALVLSVCPVMAAGQDAEEVTVSAERLEDQIRGGLLGQILGNLNGLPHEMKYIAEPGNVETYVPALPEGARTDDDTDLEWVYISEMQRSGEPFLNINDIHRLWKTHINRGIWCANLYTRRLMDVGVVVGTGSSDLNPWSSFNISGSFVAETFALVCPQMPKTAADLGLHYTTITIDGEPAQLTQFVTGMIAVAFYEQDVEQVIQLGLDAVDGRSILHRIARDVRGWVKEHPQDWRATRQKIRDNYTRYNGEMAGRNGHELNTAATIAALLYGGGDFVETLRLAFNFGWDCDNNAATCGTILGVMKGRRWMDGQGWVIKDVYRNTSRDGMPMDETITRFGDRVVAVARQMVHEKGGKKPYGDQRRYVIRRQRPQVVRPLWPLDPQGMKEWRAKMAEFAAPGLKETGASAAGAAYVIICVGDVERVRRERPAEWAAAVGELRKTELAKLIFEAPRPHGPEFREKARRAGLEDPRVKK